MKILLSNDDGVKAIGLAVLEEIALQVADEVVVVAPDSNMSGTAHSLTLNAPLRLTTHDSNHYSVNGTPTDSVVMAIRHVMPEKPDYVLSGVNYDSNLSDDMTYSGTVAAAMEGTLLGVPSIAFSQKMNKDGTINWDIARWYGPEVLRMIFKKFTFPKDVLLNINFPSGELKDVKGIKVTCQGTRIIEDHVIMSLDPRGKPYFWIGPAEYRKNDDNRDLETDLGAVNSGYVSVTPISLDMTSRSMISVLGEVFEL